MQSLHLEQNVQAVHILIQGLYKGGCGIEKMTVLDKPCEGLAVDNEMMEILVVGLGMVEGKVLVGGPFGHLTASLGKVIIIVENDHNVNSFPGESHPVSHEILYKAIITQ